MPLIRKPTDQAAAAPKTNAHDVLESLASADADIRWTAARDAANIPGGGAALALALRSEDDPRVREAMFTSLARIATPDAVDAVVALLRSDDANLRTGALDTLRIMVVRAQELLPRLLRDDDVDVRILSCELARSLGSAEATRLMCGVLDIETEVNVCAAAVDVLAEVAGAEALPSLRDCALKFPESAFLSFAINTVIDRLAAQSSPSRA
jgi:HEAT repeat protein